MINYANRAVVAWSASTALWYGGGIIGRHFYGQLKLENQVSFIPNRSLGLEVLNTVRSNLKIITRLMTDLGLYAFKHKSHIHGNGENILLSPYIVIAQFDTIVYVVFLRVF